MLTVLHDHFELIDSWDAFHLKTLRDQIGQFVHKFRHFDGLVQTVFLMAHSENAMRHFHGIQANG